MASCVRGYHMYSEKWIAALEELYCERNVINRYAVAVKLTMRFAAVALNDIEMERVPLGLGKVLPCVEGNKVKLQKLV